MTEIKGLDLLTNDIPDKAMFYRKMIQDTPFFDPTEPEGDDENQNCDISKPQPGQIVVKALPFSFRKMDWLYYGQAKVTQAAATTVAYKKVYVQNVVIRRSSRNKHD